LGVQVIAEGVEDRGVFEALLEAGCDAVQGYDIARPMGEIALAQWLIARTASETHQSLA
jgi:EAL domain-containing protein (putative c-di-GMP-specific phosphodiesterase class I)